MKSFYMAKGSKILYENHLLKIEDFLRQKEINLNDLKIIQNVSRIRTSFGEELFVSPDTLVETLHGEKKVKDLSTDDYIKCDWQLLASSIPKGSTMDWIQGFLLGSVDFFDDKIIKINVKNKSNKDFFVNLLKKEFNISTIREEALPKNIFQITLEINNLKKKDLFHQTKIILTRFHTDKKLPANANCLFLSGFLESLDFNGKYIDLHDGKLAYDLFYKLQLLRIYSSFYRGNDSKSFRVNIFDLKNKLMFYSKTFSTYTLLEDLKEVNTNEEKIWGKVYSVNNQFKNMESYPYPFEDESILLGGCYVINKGDT